MDLDEIKRGLRAEINKRENEQYATFQCNVRQMCKDVLAKLEEHESVIAEKDKKIQSLEHLCENYRCDCDDLAIMTDKLKKSGRSLQQKMNHQKYKRCMAMAERCKYRMYYLAAVVEQEASKIIPLKAQIQWYEKRERRMYYWKNRWLELAEKFKEARDE